MISHKLNEIEQISDSITIIRDGKSIETLRVKEDGVDENRIIRGMVGRDLESRFPEHTSRSSGRSSSRSGTGPSGTPTSPTGWSARARASSSAGARSSVSPASWGRAAPS